LATKFKVYDDDDDDLSTKKRSTTLTVATAAASSSPSRRDRTKVVDVDKEISKMSTTGSNSKTKNLAGDANFLSSLKAQGFEETQSKTKLVRILAFLITPQPENFIINLFCILLS